MTLKFNIVLCDIDFGDTLIGCFNSVEFIASESAGNSYINLSEGESVKMPNNKKSGPIDIRIDLLDEDDYVLGSYTSVAIKLITKEDTPLAISLCVPEYLTRSLNNKTIEFWELLSKPQHDLTGYWKRLDEEDSQHWLQILMLFRNRNTIPRDVSIININGNDATSLTRFLFSFSEALFGPIGYVGRGLTAFDDCLSKIYFSKELRVVWSNWNNTQVAFENRGDEWVLEELCSILKNHKIRLETDAQ